MQRVLVANCKNLWGCKGAANECLGGGCPSKFDRANELWEKSITKYLYIGDVCSMGCLTLGYYILVVYYMSTR